MSADRELLELAAKAAGIEVNWGRTEERDACGFCHMGLWTMTATNWNPLTDDGDVLRLAIDADIKFGLTLEDASGYVESGGFYRFFEWDMHRPSDRYEATRRAIVLTAADIGRRMT